MCQEHNQSLQKAGYLRTQGSQSDFKGGSVHPLHTPLKVRESQQWIMYHCTAALFTFPIQVLEADPFHFSVSKVKSFQRESRIITHKNP